METKFCCEEMKEFVKSIKTSKTAGEQTIKKGVAVYNGFSVIFENHQIDEMCLGKDDLSIPNLIFRFCPYCGSAIKEGEVKKTKNGTFNKLSELVFNKELDEEMSVQCRLITLEEILLETRKILKASADLVEKE